MSLTEAADGFDWPNVAVLFAGFLLLSIVMSFADRVEPPAGALIQVIGAE